MAAQTIDRLQIYRRLALRNRVVDVLRIAVPAIGLVVLAVLAAQIYLSGLGARFGVGQITVTREAIMVDAPQYSGVLDDGSIYHIAAASAQAAPEAADIIDLADVTLILTRTNGVILHVTAEAAQLDTSRELVLIAGRAHVVESTGTNGVFDDSVFDWRAQTLTGRGPVDIDYADGSHLVATGLVYEAQSMIWTFSGATVTLPDTPGAGEP